MKRKLTLLLTAFLLLTGMTSWGQSRSVITDQLDRELTGVTGTTYTSWEGKTSNSDAVYAGQSAGGNESIQLRSNGSSSGIITTASGGTVTNIAVTWHESTANGRTLNVYGSHSAYTSPTELYDENTQGTLLGTIVNGTSTELEITESYEYIGLRSNGGAMYLQEIDITWTTGGTPPHETVATPTFNPVGGIYFGTLSVAIDCTTEGASIFYTDDGTEPSESSTQYEDTLTISETTTIKAKAFKTGYTPSSIATATYTLPELITIAEAHALEINEYALVQGVVTFIDNRNVYIQDTTGGICLFLNSGTVPSELVIGDLVRAYGKRATYNGLYELSGINGNSSAFTIISNNNELPLVIKTIAEINEGGDDALQCTRVKIEEATIGAINTSGNTLLTQGENSINIYKVPELTGIQEGNVVDVIGVVGYFNTPQIRVAQASDVVLSETPVNPEPQLTVSTSVLNDFSYVFGEGPSAPKNFTVSGSELEENVSLTAPQDYEISLDPDNGYEDSKELPTNDGTLAETTIYVRLKAGLDVGTYSGNLTVVSGDLSHSIALNGTVNETTVVIMTIAEARALENGQFARVEGTVIFLDGRNVYIQDETAGIDLYLNSNTVPSSLAVGDNVRAYGSKSVFRGLVELSGINGGDADEFSILSSGNELPLAVKTIAEINTDFEASNMLQSTRVKIENAIIGTINPSGITVISQDNNILNIYLMPDVEGLIEGNEVTVTGVIGCYNTPQLRIASAEDVLFEHNPILTANPNSLSGFTYEYTSGGPSGINHFELSGNYLTNDVAVYPSESFEVSTQSTIPFIPENPAMVNIPESGQFSNVNIYVQMKSGLEVGTYSERLAVVSEGADTLFINVTGVVTGDTPTPPPTDGNYIRITNLSQLVAGSQVVFAARYNGNATEYQAMSNTSSGHPSGVSFSSITIDGNEILPDTIVDEENNFYWTVGMTANGYTFTNAAGELIGYSSSTSFATGGDNIKWNIELGIAGDEAMVPNYTGFVINNVNTPSRCFALNSNYNYGAYHTNNINNSGYNFYLDLFVKTEGTNPPPTTPVVTVSPLNLNGFTYIEGNGPSTGQQYFTVSGFNLSGNIIVHAATDYEIRTSDGEFTLDSIVLVPINGIIQETPIYVQLIAGLAVGEYNNENITISSADIEDIYVTCSGNVTALPVPGGDYVRINDVNELAAGNKVILASRYNETSDAYLAITNTLTSGRLNTTPFTSEMNAYDEIIPSSISADEDNYYWTVGITTDGYTFTNANGDMIGYGNSGTNLVMNGEKTIWTVELGISDTASLVPDYIGYKIVNFVTDSRAMALRVTETESIVKAYSTSNINNGSAGEYNFFLDIFMQGEGGVPPTPTVATPTFTPPAGTYYEAQYVNISCTTVDAEIHYTLDGSNPTEASPTYDGIPLYIEATTTIKAIAIKAGYNNSDMAEAIYIIQDDLVIIFNQDWEDDWHGWTEVLEYGDSLWRIASYQGNHYAYANGYNHPATADWLISPAFDLDSYSDVVLTFLTAKNYTGPDIDVLFSNEYDGGEEPWLFEWDTLSCDLSSGSWNWTPSGDISLDDYEGSNCHIAFKYHCTDDEAAGWEVDDILLVAGGGATPTPTLTATPNSLSGFNYVVGNGPSDTLSYTLTGANLEGEGYITVSVVGEFEILNEDGTFSSNPFDLHYSDGVIDNQPVTITVRMKGDLAVGSYSGEITHVGGGATAVVNLSGVVYDDNVPSIVAAMPLYIQGNNGSNNDRVPVAVQVTLLNLEPNTTYRYTNQLVDENDGPETAGAGNVIYASDEGFYRTTSPSLETEGNYGEFTTTANGSQIIWFMNEPTANARFTPGNHVYLRIRINDGHDGTEVANTFTSNDYATVLNFGTENNEYSGSAFYVKSEEVPMSFAMLLSDANDYRPLYSTSIETTGVDYGSINQYADFYKEKVAGKDGWFGGILPNVNQNGVNRIVIWDIYSYTLNEYYSEDGQWNPEANTVNPNAGLDEPIFIDLTYEGVEDIVEANVTVWNTDHEFVIENGDNAHYSMTVYNILGQPMMMKQINAGSTERISHSLASGVYVIRLQNNQNSVSVKVFVR